MLSGEEEIPVITAYEIDGEVLDGMPSSCDDLSRLSLRTTVLKGWSEPLDDCRSFADLPQAAQDYVAFIEQHTGVRVGYIGVGPGREATIER